MTLLFAESSTGSCGHHRGRFERWGVSAVVIYDQARSIYVINFANEWQNDAVLASFNMSLINVFSVAPDQETLFLLLCPAFFFLFFFFVILFFLEVTDQTCNVWSV